jgi:DNA-binding transcriptional regulator YiaG
MKTKHPAKPRSAAFAAIHEAAEALHHVGTINKITMRYLTRRVLKWWKKSSRPRYAPCVNVSRFRSRFSPIT